MGMLFMVLNFTKFLVVAGKKCQICKKKCTGEIVRADGDKFFHIGCFACKSKVLITNWDEFYEICFGLCRAMEITLKHRYLVYGH